MEESFIKGAYLPDVILWNYVNEGGLQIAVASYKGGWWNRCRDFLNLFLSSLGGPQVD